MASPTKYGGKQDTPFTPERKLRFLDFLADAYSLSGAARAVGVHPDTVYDHRRSDPAFAASVEEAIKRRGDFWEDQLRALGARPRPDTLAVIVGLKKEGRFVDARDQVALQRLTINQVNIGNDALARYSVAELEAMLSAVQQASVESQPALPAGGLVIDSDDYRRTGAEPGSSPEPDMDGST